jgi:hypothetical protein
MGDSNGSGDQVNLLEEQIQLRQQETVIPVGRSLHGCRRRWQGLGYSVDLSSPKILSDELGTSRYRKLKLLIKIIWKTLEDSARFDP